MSIAYFDNAATTYVKPQEMHDFMHDFYCHNSINVGRGSHSLLTSGSKIIKNSRSMLKRMFNANIDYEVVFSHSATEAINVILQGQNFQKGEIVYISPFEHNAVYRTLKHLERTKGIEIIELACNKETLEFEEQEILSQFAQKKPKFIAVSHVSNVCGNIANICLIGKLASKYSAKYMVDCAQSAGLLETNIVKAYADYMVFAGHKNLYGPFGVAGFVMKKSSSVPPLIFGGTGIDSANEDMPNELPTRYEAGSQNIMAIAGLYKALEWNERIGIENIREKEQDNYTNLVKILSSYDFIEIVGKGSHSTSVVACVFEDYAPDSVGQILSDNGVMVRTGLDCAPIAHKFLNTYPAGTVRFSVSYFTNEEDFKKLKQALDLFEE